MKKIKIDLTDNHKEEILYVIVAIFSVSIALVALEVFVP
jgi:hypothetical protein